jgi:hypothetical protein
LPVTGAEEEKIMAAGNAQQDIQVTIGKNLSTAIIQDVIVAV